jgi:carbon storage regulator
MLVLTRKVNEKLYIGEDIVITVTKIKGQAVSIGIEAPKEINVNRHENRLCRIRPKRNT